MSLVTQHCIFKRPQDFHRRNALHQERLHQPSALRPSSSCLLSNCAVPAGDVILTADHVSVQGAMQQTDACGAVINVPKIAMLFLGTKGFPHAAMWAMWFQQVRGLVPKDCVAKAFCPGRGTKGDVAGFNELVQACGPTDESQGAQRLRLLPSHPLPTKFVQSSACKA